MASTNVAGSKGARSSGPSPSPTSFTGTPSSRWTATTMPPLAVPSSLVRIIPVMSTASANTRAWRRPFCPVVASSTSRTSSTVACRSITRLIFPSSSISPALVCRRPAVSTMTVSACSPIPSLTASNATLAGSAPSRSDRTTWAPTRCPHVSSWSAAAARKVSAAPSSTDCPSPIRARASLPQALVLPVPFTPTISTTAGRSPCGPIRRLRSRSAPTAWMRSARSSALTASPWAPSTFTWVRSSSTSCRAGVTPMSAASSVSSISSHAWSSRPSRDSSPSRTAPNPLCERASLPRSRTIRPASGGGASATGAGPGGAGGRPGGAWTAPGACAVSAVAVPVPAAPVSPGGAGGASGPARPRRPGRTKKTPPAMARTTTTTMAMIRYSITAPVWQMPAGCPGRALRPLGLPQALAHDRGHAIVLHADPIQRVRGLHRPLLVRDDDQLRGVPQLLEDLQEALEVGVVERRLDLVQHVERRRPGPEDRHQEGDRRHRALAAGQQGQPLDLLARGPRLEVDPGRQHVVGLGQDQLALAAGEQAPEDLLELPGGVLEGGREHLLDPVVHLLDDGQQVAAGLLEVLELRGEERVPFLQGRVRLQGQRVHLAELVELALRRGGPPLLLGPDVGDGGTRRIAAVRRCSLLTAGGRHLGVGRPGRRRYQHVRAVLGDQRRGVHAELLHGAPGDLLQPHPVLSPDDLRAMCAVDHPVEFLRQLADLHPHGLDGVRPAFAGLLGRLPLRGGNRQRLLESLQGHPRSLGHRTGDPGLLMPQPAALGGRPGRLALADRRRGQRVRAPSDRPEPFLGRPDLEAGVGLGLPGGGGPPGEFLAARLTGTRHLIGSGHLIGR